MWQDPCEKWEIWNNKKREKTTTTWQESDWWACFVCGHGPLCVTLRGGGGEAAGRNHHRVCRVSLMWSGINETVLSDGNQWARLFGGLSESIILLSCCVLVLQREGQGGRGDTEMSGRCCWWSRVNGSSVKGSLCVKNIYKHKLMNITDWKQFLKRHAEIKFCKCLFPVAWFVNFNIITWSVTVEESDNLHINQ